MEPWTVARAMARYNLPYLHILQKCLSNKYTVSKIIKTSRTSGLVNAACQLTTINSKNPVNSEKMYISDKSSEMVYKVILLNTYYN